MQISSPLVSEMFHAIVTHRPNRLSRLRLTYLSLVQQNLPQLAQRRNFPVCHPHSFQRIILDNLFGCCWCDVLDRSHPPHLQMQEDQLMGAIAIAKAIITNSDEYLYQLNQNSMRCWNSRQDRDLRLAMN